MSRHRVEIIVSGVVQGVGFRYFLYRSARLLGVAGWVKNLPDGCVQAVAEGQRSELEILIKELKVGPRFASVRNVDLRWSEPIGDCTDFEVR